MVAFRLGAFTASTTHTSRRARRKRDTITNGASGTLTVTIDDTSDFTASTGSQTYMAYVTCTNPKYSFSRADLLAGGLSGLADRPGQILFVKIVSKTSTTLTFDAPLPLPLHGEPQITALVNRSVSGVGLRNFIIDCNAVANGVAMEGAYGCYLRDMEVKNYTSRSVTLSSLTRCELSRNYLHDGTGAGSGTGNLRT
jgi:hypothetical protein